MQMISDFMHFDNIALRQKNAILKVDGYYIRSLNTNLKRVKKIEKCFNEEECFSPDKI